MDEKPVFSSTACCARLQLSPQALILAMGLPTAMGATSFVDGDVVGVSTPAALENKDLSVRHRFFLG